MSTLKQFQPDAGNNTAEVAVTSGGQSGVLPVVSGQGAAALQITNNGTNTAYLQFGATVAGTAAVVLPATDGTTLGSFGVPAGAIMVITRPDNWGAYKTATRSTQTANLIFTAGQGV